jgi:arylsulfatase A-like enzyme
MTSLETCVAWLMLVALHLAGGSSPLPHIVFIVMDDLGSHDLGMHGSGIETPNCDWLAAQGIYLSNYYVLPTCSPTRAAIMSGKYPLHTGVHTVIKPESTRGLPLDEETIPQVLKKAGYSTHAVGKWHLGHSSWEQTPTFRGFDSFFGYYLGGQDYFTHRQQGSYDLRWDREPNCGAGCSVLRDETGNYSTHVYTREAIHRIREHQNSEQPLFLYLAYQAVHNPNAVPEEYKTRYNSNVTWNDKRITYAGMLTAADEGIGNVTAALKEYGLWENSLLVFTTDNGGPTEVCAVQGSSNFPLRGGKCTVWEGGTTGDGFLSGPYLAKLKLPSATTAEGIFHAVDWLPTLGEIAGGVQKDGPIDGVSQLNALRTKQPARKEVFVGYGFDQRDWYGPAIRVNHWKLIEGSGGPDALKQAERHYGSMQQKRMKDKGRRSGFFNEGMDYKIGKKNRDHRKKGFEYNHRQMPDEESFYLLFNLELDKEELHNVADLFPEIVKELVEKLEAYKREFVPEAAEKDACTFEIAQTEMGATWLPWCNDARRLLVYE